MLGLLVCVCVSQRECMCVYERMCVCVSKKFQCVCVYMCVRDFSVCVCESERRVYVCECFCVWVCVCVCFHDLRVLRPNCQVTHQVTVVVCQFGPFVKRHFYLCVLAANIDLMLTHHKQKIGVISIFSKTKRL